MLSKTWRTARGEGLDVAVRKARRRLELFWQARAYQRWIREFDTITAGERAVMRNRLETFERRPLISVLMPVYNVDEAWLRKAVESVLRQSYPDWELCIADDHSTKPHIRPILNAYAAADRRIKVVFRETNGHISAASNTALELVEGEFTALLEPRKTRSDTHGRGVKGDAEMSV